eukprot:g5884.t1
MVKSKNIKGTHGQPKDAPLSYNGDGIGGLQYYGSQNLWVTSSCVLTLIVTLVSLTEPQFFLTKKEGYVDTFIKVRLVDPEQCASFAVQTELMPELGGRQSVEVCKQITTNSSLWLRAYLCALFAFCLVVGATVGVVGPVVTKRFPWRSSIIACSLGLATILQIVSTMAVFAIIGDVSKFDFAQELVDAGYGEITVDIGGGFGAALCALLGVNCLLSLRLSNPAETA